MPVFVPATTSSTWIMRNDVDGLVFDGSTRYSSLSLCSPLQYGSNGQESQNASRDELRKHQILHKLNESLAVGTNMIGSDTCNSNDEAVKIMAHFRDKNDIFAGTMNRCMSEKPNFRRQQMRSHEFQTKSCRAIDGFTTRVSSSRPLQKWSH